jgi:hypothetical protein
MKALLFSLLTLALIGGGPVPAAATTDEQRLHTEEKRIDRDLRAAKTGDADHSAALAEQYNVPEQTVQNLRSKAGWGGVTIQLAMAQKLAADNPTAYPTMDSALAKIADLRQTGAGWGKVAQDLGFKLGPVISSAQRARHQLNYRATDGTTPERGPKTDKPERGEKGDRPDRGSRLENPGRPDHPAQSHRPEKPSRP